jgi:hypothetical protein
MSRGDGSYTHGNSFANGAGTPRLDWELAEVLRQRVSIWTYLEPAP